MLWVDHDSYFGPDRRRTRSGMRFHERRKHDCAGPPPSLSSALRHLRLHVIGAQGPRVDAFIERTRFTAMLAEMQDQRDAAEALIQLSRSLNRSRGHDVRDGIYDDLARVSTMLRAA